ncbi:MAG: hypothetical protein LBG29_07030 [Synergistaceae bacterium]|nr:hypothetical protein [Synergistaceae bacterium]
MLLLFTCQPSLAADISLPVVDREAAEKAFLKACGYLLENRFWDCMDSLDDTLRYDTYFVDAYYVRSLALRKMGRYDDAIRAMSLYLEVRYDDYRARMILDSMKSQKATLQNALYPADILSGTYFEKKQTSAFFNIPLYHKLSLFGMRGLGKISASGSTIFVCDTLGGGVYFSDRSGPARMGRADIPDPVAVVPLAPSESLLFQKSGDVLRVFLDSRSWRLTSEAAGSLDPGSNISDADAIDSTLVAVADRTGQSLGFYALPSLDLVRSWRPPDAGDSRVFEPVAVATRGIFTAVADRGNGKVYVLDSYSLEVEDYFDAELPRDLAWGSQGELFVLSESGRLYRRFPVVPGDIEPDVAAEGMKDAWSVAWTGSGPVVSDISGRIWNEGVMYPKTSGAFGALDLFDPWIEESGGEGEPNTQNLVLRASMSSVFQSYIQGRTPDIQVVWRGESRPSSAKTVSAQRSGEVFYYSLDPAGSIVNDEVRRAFTVLDVLMDLAASSRSGTPLPEVLVLDTRISGSNQEQELLFCLAFQNGIRLDLWALHRPAAALMAHVSQATLGFTYYSPALGSVSSGNATELILNVPLPPDVTTYGYPSDATLSVFSAIDIINFFDWIPIWPSMLKRVPQGGADAEARPGD